MLLPKHTWMCLHSVVRLYIWNAVVGISQGFVCDREKKQIVVLRNNQSGKKERSSSHHLGMHKQGVLDTPPSKRGCRSE